MHEGRVAAELLGNHALGNQFLPDAIRVGVGLVDLIHRHHQRHTGSLGMGNRFLGLRHHAIVGRNHQNHDVGSLGAARAHRRKRFVSRRIQEGDHAARRFHVIRADMLGNAARLAMGDTGFADIVEQRGLAVVHMSHHRDHRRSRRHDVFLGADSILHQESIGIVQLGGKWLMPHFLDENHRRFLIEHLIDSDHGAHLHQGLDHFSGLYRHLVRQVGN